MIFTYDANGSQIGVTSTGTGGPVDATYGYDLRNKMTSYTTGGVTTTYVYDDAGNRVREVVGSTTTYYLTDTINPTGYAQPIEVRTYTGSSPALSSASLQTTYIIGDHILGQANSSGVVSYLLVDGQDNTRALVNSSGVVTATFNFDAFGNPLGFNPATAPTAFLFQQMMFDPASGLNFTESRQAPLGALDWIERDLQGYSDRTNPITGNAYLLDSADAINNIDPTGHYTQEFGNAAHEVIGAAYFETHPGSIINPTIGVFSALKPDIYDPLNQGYAEIKPLSFPGVASGLLQIESYDEVYGLRGELELDYHRITNWPASPTFATVVAVDGESDEVVYFNVDGLIFYTNLVEDVEELKQLRDPSQVYQFLRNSVKEQIENIQETVQNFEKQIVGEEEADLGATEAAATLDSVEGAG
jgi:YD repeat-containing protein